MMTRTYQHRKLNSNDDDQADLYADDPLANEDWTAKYQELDADKELERALNDTHVVRLLWRVAHVYYFCAFFDLALIYFFVITVKSVHFLKLF